MSAPAWGIRQTTAYNAIVRVCANDLPTLEFLRQLAAPLRAAVPYDAGGLLCTDPGTLLFTGAFVEDVPPKEYLRLFDNELFCEDFAKFDRIARKGRRAASLLAETGGELDLSARHREIYRPNGFQGEVRAVFRSGTAVLGVGCFTRSAGGPHFSDSEVAFMEGIADIIGEGLRRALVHEHIESGGSDAPGMFVIDPDDSVSSMTAQAQLLLEEMRVDAGTRLELPSIVYHVAHAVRRVGFESPALSRPARIRLPSGRWIAVHASRLLGAGGREDRIAVVLQPENGSQLAPLLITLYGLTERERQVTELLIRGLSLEAIAQTLSISLYTVRDHVKAIFGKVEVGSRPELTAKLLYEHFAAPAAGPHPVVPSIPSDPRSTLVSPQKPRDTKKAGKSKII